MSAPSFATSELAVREELAALREEVAALRQEVAALRQRADDQGLRLAALRTQVTPTARRRATSDEPPVQPPLQRPMDYWADHVPDFGDDLSEAEIQRHLARPVRQAKPPTTQELRASMPRPRSKRVAYQWSRRDAPGLALMLSFLILLALFVFAVSGSLSFLLR
ncbi:hypothetical protein F8S13_18655 [Chloroflexia bacterium SDU3-3]|nr:hypothetical protein F8S13_18655 [Chloroflexia bacterium SDU3-3]